MSSIKEVSTRTILNEMKKRESDLMDKATDAHVIMEKIKLIAYGFPEKYDLESTEIDKTGEMIFVANRDNMNTEFLILIDYIQKLDDFINSIVFKKPDSELA